MNYYVIIHKSSHGIGGMFFKSKKDLLLSNNSLTAKKLGIDYKQNFDEHISITQVNPDNCKEI